MQLAILDRDGVINHDSPRHIRSPDEWSAIPGSLEAIARLNQAGFRVVVASNQSGLRRRYFNIDALNAVHSKLHAALAEVGGHLDAIIICPCLPKDNCECRKPAPGMLLEVADRLRSTLEGVPYIGDKVSDVQAARAAGARPLLIDNGLTDIDTDHADLAGVATFSDLASAVAMLLAENSSA